MFSQSYSDMPSGMKKLVQIVAFFLLGGLTLSSFAFALWYVVSARDINDKVGDSRQFTVSGEGKITSKPTIATFTAGITVQAEKIGDAQSQANTRSAAIVAYLKSKGIQEKDITTINYYISPQYTYNNPPPCYGGLCTTAVQKPPQISGYQVNTTIQIKVRDLTKADDLISGVVANGANEVGSLNFTLDDQELEALREQARQKAIVDARTKADAVAKDLGVSIKNIAAFSESGGPVPYYDKVAYSTAGVGGGAVPAPSAQVQPGEAEITANVSITYQFR